MSIGPTALVRSLVAHGVHALVRVAQRVHALVTMMELIYPRVGISFRVMAHISEVLGAIRDGGAHTR